METEGSLPHSQVPANCPYLEPARFSPFPHISPTEDPSNYYPSLYVWNFKVARGFLCEHFLTSHVFTVRSC